MFFEEYDEGVNIRSVALSDKYELVAMSTPLPEGMIGKEGTELCRLSVIGFAVIATEGSEDSKIVPVMLNADGRIEVLSGSEWNYIAAIVEKGDEPPKWIQSRLLLNQGKEAPCPSAP